MLRNFLSVTLRSIARSRINFAINIIGLSIGLACCMLVILFVKDEVTYDQFHEQADLIYRPYAVEKEGDQVRENSVTPGPLGPTVVEQIPEVKEYVIVGQFSNLVKKEEEPIQETLLTVSPSFFRVFSFELLHGDSEGILEDQGDLVLTRSMARKYFDRTNVIGESLQIMVGDNYRSYIVRAVTEDVPSNSSIQFDFLIGEANNKLLFPERMLKSWFAVFNETYFLLEEGSDARDIEEKIKPIIARTYGENSSERSYELFLQPLTGIHLDTEVPAGIVSVSDPRYSYILSSVALVILVIACVNFMNLSIGLSISRAKEIGMRKIMGAGKKQLIGQFLGESMFFAFIASVLAVILVVLALPAFNELANRNLQLEFSLTNSALLLIITLGVGLGAGSYPALILARFSPLNIIKGRSGGGLSKNYMRSIMMTLQFVFSIFLIASTLIMSRQLTYLSERNLGYNQENLVIIQAQSSGRGIREMISKGMEEAELFKDELAKNPDITGIGISTFTPGSGGWLQVGYNDNGLSRSFQVNVVDDDYIRVNEMQLVAGRDFTAEMPSDKRQGIIVNEAFVRDFGLTNPIGKRIPGGEFTTHEIIGVVADFNYLSLHTAVGPVVLLQNAGIAFSGAEDIGISSRPSPKLSVRVAANSLSGTLKDIEEQWMKIYPGVPFDFDFLDERLEAQYEQEKELNKIIRTAAILAIIIGCLGLFALSKLAIESRSKEISIRKVLGASFQTILYNFSRSYGVMIGIAFIVAVPVCFYLLKEWLSSFEYTIQLQGFEFALAGLATIVIAALTISIHSFRVIRTNPALTLRDE